MGSVPPPPTVFWRLIGALASGKPTFIGQSFSFYFLKFKSALIISFHWPICNMPPFWENQNMENKHIFYLGMHASHNASDNAEITEDVISVH